MPNFNPSCIEMELGLSYANHNFLILSMVGVAGKSLEAVTGKDGRRGMTYEFVQKINRESVRICLEGWIRGDAAVITSQADRKRFTCTWVPTGDVYNFEQFPAFYNQLKVDAERVN